MVYSICVIALGGFAFYSTAFLRKGSGCFYVWSAKGIASFDEVESVLLMSGGYDLQLVIKGQTFQEIALFVAKRLSPLDDVLSTATHFVLRTYKKEGRLYQDEEIDERECTVL